MSIASIQKSIALLTLIGILYTFYNTLVTKTYFDEKMAESTKTTTIAIVELNLMIIDESLSRVYDKGIENLTEKQKHRYNKLILAEQFNDKQRKILLGL